MASFLLLADGVSHVLRADGVSHVLLSGGSGVALSPGGAGVRIFTRKRWRELQELLARERAAVEAKAKKGHQKQQRALKEAAKAVASIQDIEHADVERVALMLGRATAASKMATVIAEAKAATALAKAIRAQLDFEQDEEDAIIMVLLS